MKNGILLLLITLSFFMGLFPAGASGKTAKRQFGDTIKILSYNVRNCKGIDDVTNYQRVADVIKRSNADFIALQELDSATQRLNKAVVLNELAMRTGMFPTYRGSISYQGGKYGIGILSREKPLKTEAIALPGREEPRSLLIVEMRNYVICCTHFSLTPEDRVRSVQMITERLRKYSKPVILAGDLNAQYNSKEINELINDFIIITDPAKPTFPANHPDRCIDYILTMKSSSDKVKVIGNEVINEPMASDHRPVLVKVIVERD